MAHYDLLYSLRQSLKNIVLSYLGLVSSAVTQPTLPTQRECFWYTRDFLHAIQIKLKIHTRQYACVTLVSMDFFWQFELFCALDIISNFVYPMAHSCLNHAVHPTFPSKSPKVEKFYDQTSPHSVVFFTRTYRALSHHTVTYRSVIEYICHSTQNK